MLKKNVLRKKADFDKLYKSGKSAADRYVVVFVRPNGLEVTRTAFLASKKVGNSVARNKARRLMKESYRLSLADIPKGVDIIFIARNTIINKKQKEVERSMSAALTKVGIK
ncbi:MAG: ribonuclease P protein component [Firmicutes bacterium]|nr:ribonuclease P protein component [Bacillota bacterium]